MCKVVEENPVDLVRTSLAREPAEVNVAKNFPALETICENINRILTPTQQDQTAAEKSTLNTANKSEATSPGEALGTPIPQDDCKPDNSVDNDSKDMEIELEPEKESCTNLERENNQTPSLPEKKESDTEMDETKNDELNENTQKSDAGVIVLDD